MATEAIQIDQMYEFAAPKIFDFCRPETEAEIRSAELWFDCAPSCAPSPFASRVKVERSVQLESMCDFGAALDAPQKLSEEPTEASKTENDRTIALVEAKPQQEIMEVGGEDSQEAGIVVVEDLNRKASFVLPAPTINNPAIDVIEYETPNIDGPPAVEVMSSLKDQKAVHAVTPKLHKVPGKTVSLTSSNNQTTRKLACSTKVSAMKQPSVVKPQNKTPSLPSRMATTMKTRCPGSVTVKKMAVDIAQENQAIKRQKLDNGKARQILNVKTRLLLHKSKPEEIHGGTEISGSNAKCCSASELGKVVVPFISAAELVKKFESRTREMQFQPNKSRSHEDTASIIQRRPKLTLTRPKDPELQTAQRVRAVRVKSSAELEEERLANMPKFKARPVNKKILEAPSLPAPPRSVPHPPEFQEFHLKTMERAHQHAEHATENLSTTVTTSEHNEVKPLKLTQPRPPYLETSLRARPPRIKSTEELEREELEKAPKFKARPLNKKIFESKGDLGLFCIEKRQVTIPQEFHFATDQRLGPPTIVADLFDKLSLHSESSNHEKQVIPRITAPNPFHLNTEERGAVKERQFAEQIAKKQLEEERAKIPKANPYPYTTDYPDVPPKPTPKPCTKPEGFQLESLVRHEEEMRRKQNEIKRMEEEEAQRRRFKAQPILKSDPIPLPPKERKPLIDVQEFILHVDDRAVHRAEFDKKIKEKEAVYKRLREENEMAQQMEEEKAVKQMRRTMVPHARPLPKFANPFLPQKSHKEATKAKSPVLRVNQRAERCHASHMR